MHEAVVQLGIVPFFEGAIPGYSIEAMTPAECWMAEDYGYGPWDWKIDVIAQGDIAYGKFFSGPKSGFATWEWDRELMNYRRSLPKYQLASEDAGSSKAAASKDLERRVFEEIRSAGTILTGDLRKKLGLRKAQIDSIVARLQMDTLVVVGDIIRVYRGPNLEYSGWQRSHLCLPESLMAMPDDTPLNCPVPSDAAPSGASSVLSGSLAVPSWARQFEAESEPQIPKRTPKESYEHLCEHIHEINPHATPKQIAKILG